MTRRKIKLVRLILDYMLSAMDEARRNHAAMSYGMLLTRVFVRVQLPVDGHRKDEKRPTTTKKTFSAMGLKLQGPDIEGEKKKKKNEEEEKKKKKKEEKKEPKRRQPMRRVSKRRLLKLVEESSSSSAEDEASTITAQPMNAAAPAKSALRPSKLRERGITIREQPL